MSSWFHNTAFKCSSNGFIERAQSERLINIEPASGRGDKGKGKHAASTENRRMVWERVVWPLVLDLNRSYFTLKEYHRTRDEFCKSQAMPTSKVAGGFVSLLVKGILTRENNIYSIHYRLIPYMRKKAVLDYGLLIREINTKR